jgi:hypothetical protein
VPTGDSYAKARYGEDKGKRHCHGKHHLSVSSLWLRRNIPSVIKSSIQMEDIEPVTINQKMALAALTLQPLLTDVFCSKPPRTRVVLIGILSCKIWDIMDSIGGNCLRMAGVEFVSYINSTSRACM